MKIENISEDIKKQWALIKVAADYLKIRIDLVAAPERETVYRLIKDTLDNIDCIFDMPDIVTMGQNSCLHTRYGIIDGIIIVTDDNPRMFKCLDCGKRFQTNVPIPHDVNEAYIQIREFIEAQGQTLEPKIIEIIGSLAIICSEYSKMYEKCTMEVNSHEK